MKTSIENIKQSIIKNTNGMFQNDFYEQLSINIYNDLFNDKKEIGYVYFIRINNKIKCKIGMTNNLMSRINSFKTTLGGNMSLDGFIYSENYKSLEKELHESYKVYRLNGEWFELDKNQIIDIINKYNGVLSDCKIDNSLIVSDGVLINCLKNNQSINYNQNEYYIINSINEFLKANNLDFILASLKEIKTHILNENNINYKTIKEVIKNNYKSNSLMRYNSFFSNSSVVGNPYNISLINESNSNFKRTENRKFKG